MSRLFGTDGVRGLANDDLTAELAMSLALAGAHVLADAKPGQRLRALVGRDTRASGEFLDAAVVAGLASAGVDVIRLGVVPTPGLAYLVTEVGADFGVMLSASHNPMPDNGIKFFSSSGVKLPDEVEDAIEAQLGAAWHRPTGAGVGRVTYRPELVERYVTHLVGSLGAVSLSGLTVVLDTANGASFHTAGEAFRRAGATVIATHDHPDGLNINQDAGSTHIESLQAAVVAAGAAAGFAFDGDADRCLAVDAAGQVVDGDQIMAVLAVAMRQAGTLVDNTIVATIMSNLGFFQAMRAHGITAWQTKVGDRYVVEAMNAEGFVLGGEQSGHVIVRQYATTGDGVLTALQLAGQMVSSGRGLAELASVMTRLPQVMINVNGVDRSRADDDAGVRVAVAEAEAELGQSGRVVLRPSGTEPLVRVMVEADTAERAQAVAERLAGVVRRRLALPVSH